jgi:arylsulfatase
MGNFMKINTLANFLSVALFFSCSLTFASPNSKRPNILVILADDLGYSDIGSFGGEISTPHLDQLAKNGIQMTSFYASPFCSPTRAMLMSGVDNHSAGYGNMGELVNPIQKGHSGYEGYLSKNVVTFPELLKQGGYHTYMVGKWHLGLTEELSPATRGFEKSYALVQGGASHFDQTGIITNDASKMPMAIYREDGKAVNLPNENFYSSDFFAAKTIEYIDKNKGDGKPFFSYLSFTAPHWPLQAPDDLIRKYEKTYDVGYKKIRDERIKKMKSLGLIPKDLVPDNGNSAWPEWSQLSPEIKKQESKRMAVYAAMVDSMDANIGKVIDYLKKIGEYDNTFIFFMSDNGAEGNTILDEGQTRTWSRLNRDNSLENIGKKTSFIEYGPRWAHVGASPFKMYKAFQYEGGISVPAIVVKPKGLLKKNGIIKKDFVHVTDIAPTVLELAGIDHPGQIYEGRKIAPLEGKSMISYLSGATYFLHGKDHVTAWELGGRKAVRKGDWKLVYSNAPWGSGSWELYDLSNDRSEQNDLSKKHPQKVDELLIAYKNYVKKHQIIDVPGLANRPGYSNTMNYYDDVKNEVLTHPTSFYDPLNTQIEK